MSKFLTRVRNAAQLVQVCAQGERSKAGKAMDDVCVITDGTLVVGLDGNIVAAEKDEELLKQAWYQQASFIHDIDGSGMSILPGFVDGHTHPVWSGDRVHEFAMKLAGATYMEVHEAGGGIGFTVRHTVSSEQAELETLFKERLDRMMRFGTTTAECKSGYGLEADTEMKMLRVIHAVDQRHPVHCVSNYLGAHSVPKGRAAAEYTKEVVEVQLPLLAECKARGEINPTLIDVFCEKGVFEVPETRAILEAGGRLGLAANFHGDELHPMGSGELGAELGVLAISHLEEVSDAGIAAMAQAHVFATLLPTTAYVLRIAPPPARKLIDAGVPVALGSDYNPNAHCLSLPHVMNLACVLMRMTMNEALVAATINAAGSIGCADTRGSLEKGKRGDFVVVAARKWEHVVYEQCDPPIHLVAVGGEPVCRDGRLLL